MFKDDTEYIITKCLLIQDKFLFRKFELEECKTQKEKDKLLDRWALEDSADKIADAIRASNRSRGLFL